MSRIEAIVKLKVFMIASDRGKGGKEFIYCRHVANLKSFYVSAILQRRRNASTIFTKNTVGLMKIPVMHRFLTQQIHFARVEKTRKAGPKRSRLQ